MCKGVQTPILTRYFWMSTWRIIPFSKWLVTPIYNPFRPIARGITPFRDLLTMVINHLQNGMILQVGSRVVSAHKNCQQLNSRKVKTSPSKFSASLWRRSSKPKGSWGCLEYRLAWNSKTKVWKIQRGDFQVSCFFR